MSESNGTALAVKDDDKSVSFIPFGETSEIKLGLNYVQRYLSKPTRNGHEPSVADCMNFMVLCKSRELNPFAGDAFLCGYDSNDGPTFNLITAAQAFFKRSEACPAFDGIESGVIVEVIETGEILEREGDFFQKDREVLLGGWARAHRKDRKVPFYDRLNLSVYSSGKSRWAKDPGGMIVKCAEASVLRQAFPTQLGGLYHDMEMEHVVGGEIAPPRQPARKIGDSDIGETPDEMPVPDHFPNGTDAPALDMDAALQQLTGGETEFSNDPQDDPFRLDGEE